MYLFDTDSISQIIKSQPYLFFIKKLASVSPEEQFTTTITVGELVYGAYKSSRPSYFLDKLDRMVWPNINILPFDEGAARIYGKVRAEMEKKGLILAEPDMRISAIALQHNLTVITGNTRHFSKVKGLIVENWLKE
jgi:tRNA(fMet)-specific endonuclease VapC